MKVEQTGHGVHEMACDLPVDRATHEAWVSPAIIDRQPPQITENEFKAGTHPKGVLVSSRFTDMCEEREAVKAVTEGIGTGPIMRELVAPSDAEHGEAYKAGVR